MKPERRADPANKLFPHHVGFTAPQHDFDAAPSDFLRIAPKSVGVHGRMLHVPDYQHKLKQLADSFYLFEDVVHCMSNNGADVVEQVGTDWVHCKGTILVEICTFCDRLSEAFETPFHVSCMCLVEGLRALDADKIAVNPTSVPPVSAANKLPVNGIAVILPSVAHGHNQSKSPTPVLYVMNSVAEFSYGRLLR